MGECHPEIALCSPRRVESVRLFLRLKMVTLKDRFLNKIAIDHATGCWLWLASASKKGYGKISFSSRGKHSTLRAHRCAWELYRGPIPAGLEVMHNCPCGDNKSCVNPDHLMLGTPADHGCDRAAKSQMRHSDTANNVRLTTVAVRKIRQDIAAGRRTAHIAREHNVADATIHSIKIRRTWNRVP